MASSFSAPTSASSSLLTLPHDVSNLLISSLPLSCLPALARTCKALARGVSHPDHWRKRLLSLRMLEICEAHEAKQLFINPTTNTVDWHMYFACCHVLLATKHHENMTFSDAELELTVNAELTRQFPPPISSPGTKIAAAFVSQPNRSSSAERLAHAGSEAGLFYLADPAESQQWRYHRYKRIVPYKQKLGERFLHYRSDFASNDLRAVKARIVLCAWPSELPQFHCSLTDYHFALLQAILLAGRNDVSEAEVDSYFTFVHTFRGPLVALRTPPVITVEWQKQSAKFRYSSTVIDRINSHFKLPQVVKGQQLLAVVDTDIVLSGEPFTRLYRLSDAWRFDERQVWKLIVRKTAA